MTALHFRAENFEATATRVDLPTPERSAERNITHYVISPRGEASKTLCLYRPEKEPLGGIVPFRGAQVSIMTPRGWKEIAMRVTAEDPELLALAISLLYSVPGVEVVKSRDERIDELEKNGNISESTALGLRLDAAKVASKTVVTLEMALAVADWLEKQGDGETLQPYADRLRTEAKLGAETHEPKSRDVIPPDRCPECRLLLPEHRMMCSWEEGC